ncbi:hypothetical protein K435DRAFT_191536 [Dendrothele bispora CBS 962.96]|uniref:DUF7223 domain-containing protein n=1 Tax=Dendrothele bispora (strain CBS 962.96) TaxID=1314807 RepID=A0A4S8LV34_DENBC|nr:hypothetical protein K435DRAFT_191536 [Dendrothele bispora CBS 962.96]
MPLSIGTTTIALFSLLLSSIYGFPLNDWNQPCFNGECTYSTNSGSIKIWGSPDTITDITTAAGWEILDCDPNALKQNIRLVCTEPNGCSHLYQANGPVGKLVRLPQDCGGNAFARISHSWVHEDQSLPANLARTIRSRGSSNETSANGTISDVQGLALDTDFAAGNSTQTGNVSIAIIGSNVPNATASVEDVEVTAAKAVSFFTDLFDFDEEITKNLPAVDIDQTFPVVEDTISCASSDDVPAFNASIKVDVGAKAHAVVSLGLVATGTLLPPNLDEFMVFVGLNADLEGTLELTGSASGTADSGKIDLYEVSITGIDFPGILTLGPSFKIQAQATADLNMGANLSIDLAYQAENAKLFFPPSNEASSNATFSPLDSPLKLSVSPSVNSSSSTISAHLIPTIDLGVSALGGIAEATVFLDFDASISTNLSLNASAVANVTTQGDNSTSSNVDGCVDIGAGFDVNLGADGSFFGLFDESTQLTLFSKEFELYNKCFGSSSNSSASAKRDLDQLRSPIHKRALTCAAFDTANLVSLAEEIISAASVIAQ